MSAHKRPTTKANRVEAGAATINQLLETKHSEPDPQQSPHTAMLEAHHALFPMNLEMTIDYKHGLKGSDAIRFNEWVAMVARTENGLEVERSERYADPQRSADKLVVAGALLRGAFPHDEDLHILIPENHHDKPGLATRLQISLLAYGFQMAVTVDYDLYRPSLTHASEPTDDDLNLISLGCHPWSTRSSWLYSLEDCRDEDARTKATAEKILECKDHKPDIDVNGATAWLRADFSPREAAEWIDIDPGEHYNRYFLVSIAMEWRRLGYSASTARRWGVAHDDLLYSPGKRAAAL